MPSLTSCADTLATNSADGVAKVRWLGLTLVTEERMGAMFWELEDVEDRTWREAVGGGEARWRTVEKGGGEKQRRSLRRSE